MGIQPGRRAPNDLRSRGYPTSAAWVGKNLRERPAIAGLLPCIEEPAVSSGHTPRLDNLGYGWTCLASDYSTPLLNTPSVPNGRISSSPSILNSVSTPPTRVMSSM